MAAINAKSNIFILRNKIKETADVWTLKFSPASGKFLYSFTPGQFIIVYFLNKRFRIQGKAYTITSMPGDKFLSITVKKIGEFSGALCGLKIGEQVKITGPYGNFYPGEQIKNIVFLAGGIGVTPFYGIIKSFVDKNITDKNITLFYSNKTKADIVFFKELEDLARKRRGLKIIYILTREKNKSSSFKEFKRINIKIIRKYLKNLNSKYYFICGPIQFVNDLWRSLKKAGINEDYIKTEAFY